MRSSHSIYHGIFVPAVRFIFCGNSTKSPKQKDAAAIRAMKQDKFANP